MGQDLGDALPADRRPGQLRLDRRRRRRRACATPRRASRRWRWRCSRDIDQETVDFQSTTTTGTSRRAGGPALARSPTCWSTAAPGIAVGMATNMPPHNLVEMANARDRADRQPRHRPRGAHAHRAGPGLPDRRPDRRQRRHPRRLRDRPRLDPHAGGRRGRGGHAGASASSSPRSPTRSTRPTCASKIAELVKDRRIDGISDLRDESNREGMRLVIELKRDANRRSCSTSSTSMTQLQETFGVINLVAGRRRAAHAVAQGRSSRTTSRTGRRSSRGAPRTGCARPRSGRTSSRACMIALDHLDEVIALIRAAESAEAARTQLMERFDAVRDPGARDPRHAAAPPGRAGAPGDRRRARRAGRELIAELEGILADPDAHPRDHRRPS